MRSTKLLACASALGLMLASTSAMADGKMDRARAAVAEARGKVDAAARAGTGGVTPRTLTEAQAALREAEDDLKASRKDKAIVDAQNASRLADLALNETQRASADKAAADKSAADAQAADAARAASDAEARARAAEADAQAARNAPPPAPVIIAAPAPPPTPTSTTVTTSTSTRAPVTRTVVKRAPARRVVKRRVVAKAPAPATNTTTTVTTKTN
ncbi:MAG: hypothetical protein ABIR08_11995 [Sphingomonas sp.]